jgi:hypothetical protein
VPYRKRTNMKTVQASSWRLACVLVALSACIAGCNGITPNAPSVPVPDAPSLAPTLIRITVMAGQLPIGGGSTDLLIETVASGAVAANVHVILSVDEGELSAGEVITDRTGHAKVQWNGTRRATVTGTSGSLITSTAIPVAQPVVFPPVPPPPPPPRRPPPDPPPPPPPPAPKELTLTLTATPRQAFVGEEVLLTTRMDHLNPGEIVLAYQWDWTGDGTVDDTSAQSYRSHVYTAAGVTSPEVVAITSTGRSATGTATVFVVNR